MRPIASTVLALPFCIPVFGQQDNPDIVALTIEGISPTRTGYDVTIKVENAGTRPASVTLSGTSHPTLHSLGVQQLDKRDGWQSVGPCLDVPPDRTRTMSPGDSPVDVVPIGDASHGWSNTICPNKVEYLGGRIRAVLCVYKSDQQFKNQVPCNWVQSASFQLPEPIHLATIERGPTKMVQPVYPEKAKKARIQGTVVLSIVIGEDGDIRDVKAVKGSPILAQAAVTAVHQWHYQPYLLNGTPVSAEGKVTVNFVLPKSSGPDSSDKEKPTDR
jgi:TonB family protein